MNKQVKWFGRTVWLGVLLDWVFGVPAIFAPNWTLNFFWQTTSPNPLWVAFSALLLVLLSLFYIPGAGDPYRYPASARLGIVARFGLAIFFLLFYPWQYPIFGFVHLFLFAAQLSAYFVVWRMPAPLGNIPEDRVPDEAEQTWFEYDGSTFAEVKEEVFRHPYATLPYHRGVSLGTFTQLFNAAARNLADKRDIRPRFDKLIHSNGICYSGVWKIDQDSEFTGYFAKGSQGLVIARLSVAGADLTRGNRRAFGIACKIYPTMDPNLKVKPGNLVTVNNLSGTLDKYIVDALPTNAPIIGLNPGANLINRVIFRLMDSTPGIRLLHPISTLGLVPGAKVVTPDLILLKAHESTIKVDADDFRDELRLKNYPNRSLVYTINVKNFADATWRRIGTIEFTEDVISEGGDKRLHFWIPQDVPNRN